MTDSESETNDVQPIRRRRRRSGQPASQPIDRRRRGVHRGLSSGVLQVHQLPPEIQFELPLRAASPLIRIDKISINVYQEFPELPSYESMKSFRRHLGGPPIGARQNSANEGYGRLCSSSGDGSQHQIKIRGHTLRFDEMTVPNPLVSGKLEVRNRFRDEQRYLGIDAYLHLNPTRAANLNASGLLGSGLEDQIYGRTEREPRSGLDGKDNLVSSEFSQERYLECEDRYFSASFDCVNREVSRALAQVGSGTTQSRLCGVRRVTYSLQYQESYYELETPDAGRILERVLPVLRAYHHRYRGRRHESNASASEESSELNMNSIRLWFSNGEAIRIYAKTRTRLRIEVQHNPKKNARILGEGITSQSLGGLDRKIQILKEKAADRINNVLRFLHSWSTTSPIDVADDSNFIMRWGNEVGHDEASLSLLEQLRRCGRVAGGRSLSPDEARALNRAKRRGLLVSNSRGLYHPPHSI